MRKFLSLRPLVLDFFEKSIIFFGSHQIVLRLSLVGVIVGDFLFSEFGIRVLILLLRKLREIQILEQRLAKVICVLIVFPAWCFGSPSLNMSNAVTCKQECSSNKTNNSDLAKTTCEMNVAACRLEAEQEGKLAEVEKYFTDCKIETFCKISDFKSALEGCGSLLPEKYQEIKNSLYKFQKTVEESLVSCKNLHQVHGGELTAKVLSQCLAEKLPHLSFPDISFDSVISAADNKVQYFGSWLEEVKSKIRKEIISCEKSKDINLQRRCQFETTLNVILDNLQKPYDESSLKKTVDRITDVYINQVVQFQQKRSCYNAAGTGMQFCLVMAGMVKQTSELWPGKKLGAEVLDELTPDGKDILKVGKSIPESGKNTFKKSIFSNRKLKFPSGETIFLEEHLDVHLAQHLTENTQSLYEAVTSTKKRFDEKFETLQMIVKQNPHAKSDLVDFFRLKLNNHRPSGEEMNQLIFSCLNHNAQEKCPPKDLMAQYYQSLSPSLKGHFDDGLFRDIEGSSPPELKNYWRKDRKSTGVSSKSVTESLLASWEKNPETLKFRKAPRGHDAEMVEIEFNHNNKVYKFEGIICAPENENHCKAADGSNVKKNTLLTLYPICGDDVLVFNKPTFQQIKNNSVANFVHCH